LSNLNQFSNFLHCWKAYELCYKTHLTLGLLLHWLRTSLRPALSRFELSPHVKIARTCSKLVADWFKAKFHYAVWSQTGSKLVTDLPETC